MLARAPLLTSLIAIVSVVVFAPPAIADCAPPEEPDLNLIYPRDGARGVPTDANLFAFVEGRLSLDLNGDNVLVPDGQFGLPLPGLEPNTDYTLEFNVVAASDTDALETEISFTTGAGPAEPPQVPIVTGSEIFDDDTHLPDSCRDALFRNQCFDTGPVRFRQFAVAEEATIWRVSVSGFFTYLPGLCAPEIVGEQVGETGCATVAAIAEDGTVSGGEPFCWGEPTGIPTPAGCSHTATRRNETTTWALLAIFACWGVLVRPRQSRRGTP